MELSEYLVLLQHTFHSPNEYRSVGIIAGEHCATHREQARLSFVVDCFDEHNIGEIRVFVRNDFTNPSLAAKIVRLEATDGPVFKTPLDAQWLDDAVDEAVFVDQR